MRKLFTAICLSSLMLNSCRIQSIEDSFNESQIHEFIITTTSAKLDYSTVDTKATAKAQVSLKWEDGDAISVINLSRGRTLAGDLVASIDGDIVTFSGELSGSLNAGDMMAAIYPSQGYTAVMNVPAFELNLAEQSCSSKDDVPFVAYSEFMCKTAGKVEVKSDFVLPISFTQIALAGLEPNKGVSYIDLSNVGNKVSFSVDKSTGRLICTPSVGKVRISPTTETQSNGSMFVYCALAESPAAARRISVKSMPYLYSTKWASAAMSASKYYTSIATEFTREEFKNFNVIAPQSLFVEYQGGDIAFTVSSNYIDWEFSSAPSLQINPATGSFCENQEVIVTIPENKEASEQHYIITAKTANEELVFVVNQSVNPDKALIGFADINLKKFMVDNFDEDGDGEVSEAESFYIQTINCTGKNISDLTGLEKCKNLRYLNISNNCVFDLVLPDMPKLETLIAHGNNIEKIVLDNDSALKALYINNTSTNAVNGVQLSLANYAQSSELSISFAGTTFTSLDLSDSKVLTSYDVSRNVHLKALKATGNQLVTSIDVSKLTDLTSIDVSNCSIEALDVTHNELLTSIKCRDNALTELNIDANVALVTLDCCNNAISSLRLFNNIVIENVFVAGNKIETLNTRKNTVLKVLDVSENLLLSSLDLSTNTKLEIVRANSVAISDLDVSVNTSITELTLKFCSNLVSIKTYGGSFVGHMATTTWKVICLYDRDNNILTRSFAYDNGNAGLPEGTKFHFKDKRDFYLCTWSDSSCKRYEVIKMFADYNDELVNIHQDFEDTDYWTYVTIDNEKYYYVPGSEFYHNGHYYYKNVYFHFYNPISKVYGSEHHLTISSNHVLDSDRLCQSIIDYYIDPNK